MQIKHLNTSARLSTVCGFLSLSLSLSSALLTTSLDEVPLGPKYFHFKHQIFFLIQNIFLPGTGGEQDLFLSLSAMLIKINFSLTTLKIHLPTPELHNPRYLLH